MRYSGPTNTDLVSHLFLRGQTAKLPEQFSREPGDENSHNGGDHQPRLLPLEGAEGERRSNQDDDDGAGGFQRLSRPRPTAAHPPPNPPPHPPPSPRQPPPPLPP